MVEGEAENGVDAGIEVVEVDEGIDEEDLVNYLVDYLGKLISI